MNQTEIQGYDCLTARGYTTEDILFCRNDSPDFVTSDGKGWEIKLARQRVILFSAGQVEKLRNFDGTLTVLVFDGVNAQPVAEISFGELESIPCKWEKFSLIEAGSADGIVKKQIAMTPRMWADLEDIAETEMRSVTNLLNVIAVDYIQRYRATQQEEESK